MKSKCFWSHWEPGNADNDFIEAHLALLHYHDAGFDPKTISDADECGSMCQIAPDKTIALHAV